MLRILRNKKTRQFFNNGSWNSTMSEAQNFQNAPQAIRACHDHGLEDMELIIRHDSADKTDVLVDIIGSRGGCEQTLQQGD